MRNRFLLRAALIAGGAFVLLWMPLWNGYPLIFSDTGTYLFSAWQLFVPVDRPLGYGLFIRAASLAPSVWAIVFAQALGTSVLLFRNAELLLPKTRAREFFAFALIGLTALLTNVSMFVGWVIPDVFASWVFLGAVWFWLARARHEKIIAALFVTFAFLVHNSHLWIALGALVPFALIFVLLSQERRGALKKIAALVAVIVLGIALNVAINAWLGKGFSLGRGGNTFFVNRLHETGILKRTLARYCETETWTLCGARETLNAHEGELGWFLWNENSPLAQTDWETAASEHGAIARRALECCLAEFLNISARSSWELFWLIERENDLLVQPDSADAARAIRELYPREWAMFQVSGQQHGAPPPNYLFAVSPLARELFWLVAALILFCVARMRHDSLWLAVWFALFIFLVMNATVTGSLSGVFARYQARVFWLVTFFVLTYVVNLLMTRRRAIKRAWCG